MVNGRVRKYYTITRHGVAALADARKKIRELVGELLEGNAPRREANVARAFVPGKRRGAGRR